MVDAWGVRGNGEAEAGATVGAGHTGERVYVGGKRRFGFAEAGLLGVAQAGLGVKLDGRDPRPVFAVPVLDPKIARSGVSKSFQAAVQVNPRDLQVLLEDELDPVGFVFRLGTPAALKPIVVPAIIPRPVRQGAGRVAVGRTVYENAKLGAGAKEIRVLVLAVDFDLREPEGIRAEAAAATGRLKEAKLVGRDGRETKNVQRNAAARGRGRLRFSGLAPNVLPPDGLALRRERHAKNNVHCPVVGATFVGHGPEELDAVGT